jgi:hypothetical protein
VVGTYEHPAEVDGSANFQSLIAEAVSQTGYRGQTVSLLLAHPRLVQQLVDVPPLKDGAIRRVLQRQAQQQKLFPGEAAWAFQRSLSAKGSQQVILHLFPKGLLDQLVQGCQRNDLHLISVSPPSAVLHRQLANCDLGSEDIGLLAAETGGSTTVFIGRGDGQVLLVRTLSGTWNEGAERLALDLNRTLLFVNQQFGEPIKTLWLFGPGAQEQREAMQRTMQLPLQISPVEYTPLYWATEALKVQPAYAPNFVSLVLQQAPRREIFARAVALATALVVLSSFAAAAYCHWQARQQSNNIEVLHKQADRLQHRLQDLSGQNGDLIRKQQVVQLVIDGEPAPVPQWFLGYLGEAVPAELVVTNLHLKHEQDLWKLRLMGTTQTAPEPLAPAAFSNSIARLSTNLVKGPFHLTLPTGEKPNSGRSRVGGFPDWVSRVAGSGPVKPGVENQFVIEGVMR